MAIARWSGGHGARGVNGLEVEVRVVSLDRSRPQSPPCRSARGRYLAITDVDSEDARASLARGGGTR